MSNIKITNIILDMDGTILDYVPPHFDHNRSHTHIPIARPYLNLFMIYLFSNFERVSIWTAASKSWYDQCYEEIIKHTIPQGKQLHFVKTRLDYDHTKDVKPLQMIYEEYPELYNPQNTIIIDDNPLTFEENIEQALQIKSFYYDRLTKEIRENLDKHDFELYNMIQLLHLTNNSDTPPFLQTTLSDTVIIESIIPPIWAFTEEEDKNVKEEIDALYNSFLCNEDW